MSKNYNIYRIKSAENIVKANKEVSQENKIEENKKSVECIQILLDNGAIKSNKVNGKTAADWAEERNLSDIVKMLKP